LSGLPFLWERLIEDVHFAILTGILGTKCLGEDTINHIINQVSGLRSYELHALEHK